MFKHIAAVLLAGAILDHVGPALARECTIFTPDEMKAGTYQNVDDCTVPRPQAAACPPPRDANYRCGDGDWSYAQHRRGACSRHGGVSCTIGAAQTCCP
ncbi:DUF3761 domain-containing protein [Methylobacterium sp. J-026]|uniref:DUF3761 domain-containing protein n=1 Tax=Methylobacterium sp. J-026 TaxID=2836624 RepID=UPI001FBC10DC|nr:DUF3761 domain-containing protein [Methylobacterium sp. J-026]MCJ2136191.1 DUF3761 domain-containing protein [Methylobacterium sp. J-026]